MNEGLSTEIRMLRGLTAEHENDLRDLSDKQLSNEIDEIQCRIDEDTTWIEALTAEQKIRRIIEVLRPSKAIDQPEGDE